MSNRLSFADLALGMKARVAQVVNDDEITHRLMELGLTPGTEFRVTKIAPLGDPVEIDLRGSRLCLRRLEGSGFVLEPVS